MNHYTLTLTGIVLAIIASSGRSTKHADTIAFNAMVYTADSSFTLAEASAVHNEEFVAVSDFQIATVNAGHPTNGRRPI